MATGDLHMINNYLAPFVVSSNEALELKLVRRLSDLDDESYTFKPLMSHQVFGDSESIFGYKGLRVKLYYSAGWLTTYLGISYEEKVCPNLSENIEADNIASKLADKVQPGYHTNLDSFCADLSKESTFVPFGSLLHTFHTTVGKNRTWEIYMCDVTVPGWTKYHERLQTFILWYIDAASFLDVDDDHWRFFVVYERYLNDGAVHYALVGYASVYEYYAYPCNIRPRISQMLVLPPFQRLGVGEQLLTTLYNHYVTLSDVIDITVEDPSDDFQRLRDYVDARNCSKLASFQPHLLHKGFNREIENEARTQLKLNKKQSRRIYEILRLKATDIHNAEQYRQYRLDVKNRLNIPYRKEQLDLKKLAKRFKEENLQAARTFTSAAQHLEKLHQEYNEVEAQYQRVLERLI